MVIFEPNSKFGAVIAILLFGFYKSSAYTNQNSFVVESTPKKSKIVFLKTHETGSSTIQNIFYRYGIGNVEISKTTTTIMTLKYPCIVKVTVMLVTS